MDAEDVPEFSKQMHEGAENALRRVSLAISVLAVLVAMVTVLSHRTHTQAILLQTLAADQWNLYQAKKIRQSQVALTTDILSLQRNSNSAATSKILAEYRAHTAKWDLELADEQHKAEALELRVGTAERRADRYDLSEALLEIAVVLSSITLLTKQQIYFFLGLGTGLLGLLAAVSALRVH